MIYQAGNPAVQPVRCGRKGRGGLDWDRLNANGRRLGIKDPSPEEVETMATFHDSALSRRVLRIEVKE